MRFLAAGLAVAFALWAGTAMAQRNACIIYEHANYQGQSFGFSETGRSRRYGSFWNDTVSAVRVRRGCRLTLFEHSNFQGRSAEFNDSVSYIGREWNDRASSSICECDGGAPEPEEQATGACTIYQNANFRGRSIAFARDEETPRYGRRWDNESSSLRVKRGCTLTLFDGRNFEGESITFEGDVQYVGRRWNDRASSSLCDCSGGGRRGGRNDIGDGDPPNLTRDGYACNVFEDRNYRGRWRAFEDGEIDKNLGRRLRGDVSSVAVAEGCVAILDVDKPYQLFINQSLSRMERRFNNATDSVSCFCFR